MHKKQVKIFDFLRRKRLTTYILLSLKKFFKSAYLFLFQYNMSVITQPLTCRPASDEVRGSGPARDLSLPRSQRLRRRLLLGAEVEKLCCDESCLASECQNNASSLSRRSLIHPILLTYFNKNKNILDISITYYS